MRGFSIRKAAFVLILAAAAGICFSLAVRVRNMMCDEAYLLSHKQEDGFFPLSGLSNIEKEGISFTYAQPTDMDVSNGFRREEITVYTTNENYAYFTRAHMYKGAFFNSMQIEKRLPVIVINKAGAYRLFGNWECVGETVYLNGAPHKVIGIIEETDSEAAGIYVPYSGVMDLTKSGLQVRQIWCTFSNQAEAAYVMKRAGYETESLRSVQMDLVKKVFAQRFLLLIIVPGAYLLLSLFGSAVRKAKQLKLDGMQDSRRIGSIAVRLAAACAGLFALYKLAGGSWCAPPYYELAGKTWKDMFFSFLNFYLLTDVKIGNMPYFPEWNTLSILSAVFCLVFAKTRQLK